MDQSDELRLVPPSEEMLSAYAAALEKGWSPNNLRDVSVEQLAALRLDATAFLHDRFLRRHQLALPARH